MTQPDSGEVQLYISLIKKIKDAEINIKNNIKVQESKKIVETVFSQIISMMEKKLKGFCSGFYIAGYEPSDVYQEALIALKFKAIKDYDETREWTGAGPYPFNKFAILCIRRHLSTKRKSSYQNNQYTLNSSVSYFDSTDSHDEEAVPLMDMLESNEKDPLDNLLNSEYYNRLFKKVLAKLSKFEKEIFFLYAKKYSYEEIAEIIKKKQVSAGKKNKSLERIKKSVDNALSRIKTKSSAIIKGEDPDLSVQIDKFLDKKQDKRRKKI